jgi:hypothetical protein
MYKFFFLLFLDNFGDSDFEFLQKFGTTSSTDICLGRDSLLLKFDPLLAARQSIIPQQQYLTRLSSTKEEEESINSEADSTFQGQEASLENQHSLCRTSNFPQIFSLLEDEKPMSIEIMKDIATESSKNNLSITDCEEKER